MWTWLAAAAAYGGFLFWYQNRRGPLTAAEIDRHMRTLEEQSTGVREEYPTFRKFLEEDDGREFLMLNLVRFSDQPVEDPVTGERKSARAVMKGYTDKFLRALIWRAGHPAFLGFPGGGFVDTWGIDPGPGWNLVGMMRYRSRRDLIELVTDPEFGGAHLFKRAAIPVTCSFPMTKVRLYSGPRVIVGLLLFAIAALLH